MILMGPFQLKIFYDLCMDFLWELKCFFICASAQWWVYSSSPFLFLAAATPCLPYLAYPNGLCWLFTLKLQLSQTFFSQHIAYCFPRVSVPFLAWRGKAAFSYPSFPLALTLIAVKVLQLSPNLAAAPLRTNQHTVLLFLPLFTGVSPCPWVDLLQALMHANEALSARAELRNKEVTSLTSLQEPELRLWVSALKEAQHVGHNQRCHLVVHASDIPNLPYSDAAALSHSRQPCISESRKFQRKTKMSFENTAHHLLAPQRAVLDKLT